MGGGGESEVERRLAAKTKIDATAVLLEHLSLLLDQGRFPFDQNF